MKVKICGITKPSEAEQLNLTNVDYAGFVLYEKSKRFVTLEQIKPIFNKLNLNIIKVAVTVSPNKEMIQKVQKAGFDLLQIHGDYQKELIEECRIPVWQAVNLTGQGSLNQIRNMIEEEHPDIAGILIDAKEYGSGKTFDWEGKEIKDLLSLRERLREKNIKFILAGGLTAENVSEGIRIFKPDVVDVSSGVEGMDGKDYEKISTFMETAKGIKIQRDLYKAKKQSKCR